MKVAIASGEDSLDSKVSPVTGRAPFYLIFEDGELIESLENPHGLERGAGYKVSKMLEEEDVDMVISGRFGPVAESEFDSKGIKTKQVSKETTVKEAKEGVF